MRTHLIKVSELLVNVSIIGVAILLGVVLVKNYLLPVRGPSLAAESTIHRGTSLPLPNVDWRKADQTIVLVLSENCHYCTNSAPFYKRLVQRAGETGHNRVIAALPQDVNTGRTYLTSLGISVDEIMQVTPSAIGTSATPTLVLVDNQGVVKNIWIGQLPQEKEAEVLAQL